MADLYVVDTHVLIWYFIGSKRLRPVLKDKIDQIQRAATSVMANIAEGFDGGSNREFVKFLAYALRSATEVQSHLYVALDQGYINQQNFNSLYELSVKVKNLTSGFIRYLRSGSRTLYVER